MEKIKEFFRQQVVRTWFWNALGAFLSILAIYLGNLDSKYNVVIVPTILAITKYLNKRFSTSV